MTSEQQRGIDATIIEGRLIDAIGLYRSATGATLAAAEDFVKTRSAGLSSNPMPSAASVADAAPLAAALTKRIGLFAGVIVAVAVVVPLVLVAAITTMALKSFHGLDLTHGLAGIATITNEPYYSAVVKKIAADRGFQDALGTPIVIDNGTLCNYIHDDAVQHKANCTIPVHGPKAPGFVRVQIVDQARSIDLGAWLQAGDRTIRLDTRTSIDASERYNRNA